MLKAVAATAFALSVTVLASPAQASLDDQFRCESEGDGEHVVILSGRNAKTANVFYRETSGAGEGTESALEELTADYILRESGSRYVGGEYMLLTTNSTLVLLYGIGSDQEGHTECKYVGGDEAIDAAGEVSDAADDVATAAGDAAAYAAAYAAAAEAVEFVKDVTPSAGPAPITLNVRAGSWGGKLRSGPGMEYDQIGSLNIGDPVTLTEDTAIMMNGYPWFRLRTASGKEGYQWGGILCATTVPVDGVFKNCP